MKLGHREILTVILIVLAVLSIFLRNAASMEQDRRLSLLEGEIKVLKLMLRTEGVP